MQLVIDLGETWADEQSASDAIVEEAARRVLAQRDLSEDVRRRLKQITDEEIRAAVQPMLVQALEEGIQPTDGFGSPRGEPTTLRDMIVKEVRRDLSASRSSPASSGRRTLLEEIVSREVERAVGNDLRQAMDEARKQVRAAVEQKGAEVLAQTIERIAR